MMVPGPVLARLAAGWFALFLPATLITTLVGTIALAADRLLRGRLSAAARTAFLGGAVSALGLVPLVLLLAPVRGVTGPLRILHDGPPPLWPSLLFGVWLSGVLVGGIRLALQSLRVAAVLRRSRPARSATLVHSFRIALERSRVASARLHLSDDVRVPFTAGVRRPVVVLPGLLASRLDAEQIEAVLLHELSHVGHRDVTWQWLRRGMQVLWWLHPLQPLLAAALSRAVEERCDDDARAGTGGPVLAGALVAVAAFVSSGRTRSLPGPAMHGRSARILAARLRRLHHPTTRRSRRPAGWALAVATLAIALALLAPELEIRPYAGHGTAGDGRHSHQHQHGHG